MEEKQLIAWTSVTNSLETVALLPQQRDELISRALEQLLTSIPAVGTALIWPCRKRKVPWKVYYAGSKQNTMQRWLSARLDPSLDATIGIIERDLTRNFSDLPPPLLMRLGPLPASARGLWIVWMAPSSASAPSGAVLEGIERVRQTLEAVLEVENREERYFSASSPLYDRDLIALPILLNLVGYVIGALILSPLGDRFGRRDMIVITMAITGLGSLYTAFVGDYTNFILARAITGIGIGAEQAFVNIYVNEVAPSRERAKYTSLIFAMGMMGVSLAIWLGLYLTTPSTPFPFGLPFALATPHFVIGWRIMYGIGAWFPLVGLLLRSFALPESPRWLVSRGRLSEAERIVSSMEKQALTRISELPAIAPELPVGTVARGTGYSEIFNNALYFKRTIVLLVIWLLGYMTVYSNAAGLTVLLTALGYPAPEAGLITAMGVVGYLVIGLITYLFGERLERKYWLPIAAILALAGGIIIATSGSNFGIAALGSSVLSLGCYLWLPMTYTWSAENYPTRARTTGFALVDGVGHAGGGKASA
jgi:MFS transporter, putative metabolite:H+ symporter